MRKLLLSIILFTGLVYGQQLGRVFSGAGAPSGGCNVAWSYIDTLGGTLYYCVTGVWTAAASGAPAWSSITGTPTTLAGYGITDAVNIGGSTMTGELVLPAPTTGSGSIFFTPGVSPTGGTLAKGRCWWRTADTYFSCYDGTTTQQIMWQSQAPVLPGTSGLLNYTTGTPGSFTTAQNVDVYTWTFDGGGSQVATSSNGIKHIGAACTVTGWAIEAKGSSPTATIDVWRLATGTAIPTVANTIMGTKPALASNNAIKSTTMTNWCTTGTCTFAADDIVVANADATNAANVYMTFSLLCAR